MGLTADRSPISRHQHQNREPPTSPRLLIAKVLVGGNENIEALDLGDIEQLTVRQDMPAALERGFHLVIRQNSPERSRRSLVEKDLHAFVSDCGFKAALSALKDGVDLIAPNAGKRVQEFLDGGAAFDVLK